MKAMSEVQDLVEEATFEFTLGNNDEALEKLQAALTLDANSFEAWHALTEIYFSMGKLDEALEAGEKAHSISPEDVHINTSLSRIWVEKGDKEKAEHFGAQARMLGWKREIKEKKDA